MLWQRCWTALSSQSETQLQHQSANEPARRFRELLQTALASGLAHVAAPDGQEPDNPVSWGWRRHVIGTGSYQREEWRPTGERIGWLDGDDLYLDPDAAYAVVQRLSFNARDGVAVTLTILKKRMHEEGLLASTDDRGGRTRMEVRRTLQGVRRSVLHVRADVLGAGDVAQMAQVAHGMPELQAGDDADGPPDINPPIGYGEVPTRTALGLARSDATEFPADSPERGPIGPLGPRPDTQDAASENAVATIPVHDQPAAGHHADDDDEDVLRV